MPAQIVIILESKGNHSNAQDIAKPLNTLALSDSPLGQCIAIYRQQQIDDLAQANTEVSQG